MKMHPSHTWLVENQKYLCINCLICNCHSDSKLLEEPCLHFKEKSVVDDQEIKKDHFVLTINVYAKNEEYLRTLAAYILKDLTISADDPDHASDINIQIDRSY